MRLLLDTHALVWALGDDSRLSHGTRAAISSGTNSVLVSAASVWEVEIKRALGRLVAPPDLLAVIRATPFGLLSITPEHAVVAGSLPRHHDDPFDRMLVAQALTESLTVVTRDTRISEYGVAVLPA